jgi:hypothetical protein
VAFDRIRQGRHGFNARIVVRRGGRIELTHVNVADGDFAGVSEGWSKYYFIPWLSYLTRA